MTSNQKVFIYARKSSEENDRQVNSIKDQMGELRAVVARHNLTVVAEFEESRTAKYPGRPVFNEMIRRIKKGEATTILAWSADRLARNNTDGNTIIECIDNGILNLRFANYPFEPTPQGMLMLHMEFGMARFYVDSMGHRITMSNERRIKEGHWPRRAPLGYLFDKETKTLKFDPNRAPLIRQMFELYSTGKYTIRQLTREINDRGLRQRETKKYKGRPLSKSQYHRLLSHSIYAGILEDKEEQVIEGQHPAIIPLKLFDKCQAVMKRRGWQPKSKFKQFLYSRLFTCGECGGSVTHEVQKGHVYLRCSKRTGPCSQPFLREEEAIKQVRSIIEEFALPSDVADRMVKQLRAEQKDDVLAAARQVNDAKAELAKHAEKEQRLTMAYVNGDLQLENFNSAKRRLLLDKDHLREKLAFWEKNHGKRFEPASRFIKALQRAEAVVAQGDPVTQRDFLKNTGSNLQLKDRKLTVVFSGGWDVAWQSRFSRLSPSGTRVSHSAAEPFLTTSTGWCAMRDLNPRPFQCK